MSDNLITITIPYEMARAALLRLEAPTPPTGVAFSCHVMVDGHLRLVGLVFTAPVEVAGKVEEPPREWGVLRR